MGLLFEQPLRPTDRPLSVEASRLVQDGTARFDSVDCFDFVPSNYELFWRTLDALPRGRFCEWGSGWGIATGLAELLGFEATGFEAHADLAEASQRLLQDHGLAARIVHGDYLETQHPADVYFVYCWASYIRQTEAHFHATAPCGSRLLICNGANEIRCKTRADAAP